MMMLKQWRTKISWGMLGVMVFMMAGCTSLSRTDKTFLHEMRTYGISDSNQQVKHPAVAGAMNILPGFGNFYLACGTDESEQWLVGFMNLLFWPISVVWGIPEAVIDANNINKKEAIYYYTFNSQGRAELAKMKGITMVNH